MENKVSLYQIADSLKALEAMAEDSTELEPYLDSVELQLENKIDSIVKYRQNLTATAEAIQSEIDRLLEMKKQRERLANRLKEYMSNTMLAHNIDKIDTGLFKISFRESESTEIIDIESIPAEYLITKTTTSADKTAIKKAIKEGKEVKGAEVIKNFNIQIK